MFEWFGVWSNIKKALSGHAKDKAYKLLSKLKAARASTVSDLAALLAESGTFKKARFSEKWTVDELEDPKDSHPKITLHTLPMSTLSESAVLAGILAEKLVSNTDLRAAKNSLGISDIDWNNFVKTYSKSFVKYAMPMAIDKLQNNDIPVYIDEFVIAVAKGEAYKVGSAESYHDMVKFHRGATDLKRAKNYWKRRFDITYKKNV